MKNLLFIFLILFTLSCSDDNIEYQNEYLNNIEVTSTELKDIEDFFIFGDIHNEYLDHACVNFRFTGETKESLVEYYEKFLNDFTPSRDYFGNNLSSELNLLVNSPNIFVKDYTKYQLLNSQTLETFNLALEDGLIDQVEYGIFLSLLDLANEEPSFESLNVKIDSLILLWEDQNYSKDSKMGDYSAIVLAISKRSTVWWLENAECLVDSGSRVGPWLGADVAGGLMGIAYYMGSHYVENGTLEGCCGDGIIVSTVGGAIGASLMLTGRIGKAFSKWWG